MLVLTRKIDQAIVISGNIFVRVLGVERDRVKIGISAPAEVIVLREELVERQEKAGSTSAEKQGDSYHAEGHDAVRPPTPEEAPQHES